MTTRVLAAPARTVGPRPSGALRVMAVIGFCLAAVALALQLTSTPSASAGLGLADAGDLTRRLLPASRALCDLCALAAVGTLVAAGWLVVGDGDAEVRVRATLMRSSSRWAAGWCVAALVQLLASTSEVLGVPISRLWGSVGLLAYGLRLPQGRSLLLVVVVASVIIAWAGVMVRPSQARWLAVAALASMGPLLATGHAATASNHLLSTETLLVHVLAVTLWSGGLLALVVHVRRQPGVLAHAVPRFSRLAGWTFLALLLSGVLGAWTRLGLDTSAWTSSYGVLLLVKTAGLVALGVIGAWHRSRTIRLLALGRPRSFARLATVEVMLMGVMVGLAVVLARTSPPISATLRAAPPHASTYPTVDPALAAVSPWRLLVGVRPDAIVLTGTVAVLVATVLALRSAAAVGWTWSSRQRLVFGLGSVVLAWAVTGGLGAYATALLSVQVAQLLVLGLLVPALLALGLPRPPAGRTLRWPAAATITNGCLASVLVLVIVLETPVLTLALRTVVTHVLVGVVVLAAGLALFVPLLRADLVGRSPGRTAYEPLVVLAVALGYNAWHMRDTGLGYAGGWYADLGWWWADPVADQRVAGAVMAGFAVALTVMALLLAVRRVVSQPRSSQRVPAP